MASFRDASHNAVLAVSALNNMERYREQHTLESPVNNINDNTQELGTLTLPVTLWKESLATAGAERLLEQICGYLKQQHASHKLFDARCLWAKYRLGLPLQHPSSFSDVPPEHREAFEQAFISAAREAGRDLLQRRKFREAWIYFHAIHELQPLREALEQCPILSEASEDSEEVIEVALFKLVHPIKGVQVMLQTHGTCSTITSLDQIFAQMQGEDRAGCAAVLVRSLHRDLLHNVQRDVQRRLPFVPLAATLRELVAGREWLFAEGNYHIDCSHLQAVVRFARALQQGMPELELARDLTEYGSHLAQQFQYPGEPPFQDFYLSHREFFRVLLGEDREVALNYFRQQLEQSEEEHARTLCAYVLVDLLVRIQRLEEAIPLAEKYLLPGDEQFASGFVELCLQAGRYDVLERVAAGRGDAVTWAAAVLQQYRLAHQ
ncbi:MAG: hypothetical protein KatS3mg114_0109 [Planctomycetaceae bacterium]|nr:MAG: hypothetical protein KatS3mg114_0109 [Planctomycetaceae bacterium]